MTVLAGVREDSTFLTSIAPGMPLSLSATVKVDTCKEHKAEHVRWNM